MSKSTEHNYILSNARIYTMDPKTPSVSSLLVQQGRIEALGTNTADSSEFDHLSAERIDLQGRTILPGLCDAHIHIEKFALMLDQVDCETPTLSGCIARVAARCREAKPGAWVLGHGWNQNVWGGYGVLRDLDDISRDNPVYLTAKSLHAGWANTRALKLCGITEALKDPPRGKLQRDEQGRLTGVLFEDP
jgi:predicted amidohydrolase YtcJ